MKRWKKVWLGLGALLLAAVIGIGVWQWENIKALYIYIVSDSENLSQKLEEHREQQQTELKDNYNVTVIPPSTEQSNDLLDGKADPEDVKEALGLNPEQKPAEEEKAPTPPPEEKPPAEVKPEQPKEEPKPEEKPEEKPDPEAERKKQVEELVNQCVAELYVCEVDLMAKLGEMKQGAIAEWNALEPEQRTPEKKLEIGMAGLMDCYDLEVEIDRKVLNILENYRGKLRELEADTAVMDELWIYYCDKKADQKAYYLDKYLD